MFGNEFPRSPPQVLAPNIPSLPFINKLQTFPPHATNFLPHPPTMSALRNAVQRRNHRERAQPHERQKWGLLEKPKDYKLRAADHRVKKRKLKTLQQKAKDRNEDEFYFAMVNSESRGGVKVAKRRAENSGGNGGNGGGKVLGGDVVKLMKTQDVGYLRTMLQQTRRERERVGKEVVRGDVGVRVDTANGDSKRVVFDEDGEELPNQRTKDSFSEDEEDPEEVQDGDKHRALSKKRRKLQAIKDRERDLAAALQEVEEQRARMNGSIGDVNKDGVKFKVRQRRR